MKKKVISIVSKKKRKKKYFSKNFISEETYTKVILNTTHSVSSPFDLQLHLLAKVEVQVIISPTASIYF